jgi:hypothetical protein
VSSGAQAGGRNVVSEGDSRNVDTPDPKDDDERKRAADLAGRRPGRNALTFLSFQRWREEYDGDEDW